MLYLAGSIPLSLARRSSISLLVTLAAAAGSEKEIPEAHGPQRSTEGTARKAIFSQNTVKCCM